MTIFLKPWIDNSLEKMNETIDESLLQLITPIQAGKFMVWGKSVDKGSDFIGYLAAPFIFPFFYPFFILETAIHLVNAILSLAKGLYLFLTTIHPSNSFINEQTEQEFYDFTSSLFISMFTFFVYQLQASLSIVALFTRIPASIWSKPSDNNPVSNNSVPSSQFSGVGVRVG